MSAKVIQFPSRQRGHMDLTGVFIFFAIAAIITGLALIAVGAWLLWYGARALFGY